MQTAASSLAPPESMGVAGERRAVREFFPFYVQRKLERCVRILKISLLLLCVGLWILTLPVSKSLPLPPRWIYRAQGVEKVADYLGTWMSHWGIGSGPFSERPYDFLILWHLAFSFGVYAMVVYRAGRVVRAVRGDLVVIPDSRNTVVKVLFGRYVSWLICTYPSLTALILVLPPWNADLAAQKLFYILMGIPLLLIVATAARGSLVRPRWRWPLVVMILSIVGAFFLSPQKYGWKSLYIPVISMGLFYVWSGVTGYFRPEEGILRSR